MVRVSIFPGPLLGEQDHKLNPQKSAEEKANVMNKILFTFITLAYNIDRFGFHCLKTV